MYIASNKDEWKRNKYRLNSCSVVLVVTSKYYRIQTKITIGVRKMISTIKVKVVHPSIKFKVKSKLSFWDFSKCLNKTIDIPPNSNIKIMFTTPTFTKYSLELESKLRDLGYTLDVSPELRANESLTEEYIYVVHDVATVTAYKPDIDTLYGCDVYNTLKTKVWIDCEENETLFLAIAALRDDSDYMQVYTNGTKWIICDGSDFNRWYIENHNLHKATVTELINHFRKEI